MHKLIWFLKTVSLTLLLLSIADRDETDVYQYIDERDRILALPFDERADALEQSRVFNSNDVLGEYFSLNTRYWTEETLIFRGLEGFKRERLKQRYPYFYVEMLLDEIDYNSNNASRKYLEFVQLAVEFKFFDLARNAAMYASELLFIEGRLVESINAIEPILALPFTTSRYKNIHEPHLDEIYRGLSNAYMLLGNFNKALEYCQLSRNGGFERASIVRAKLCEANVHNYAQRPKQTFKIAYTLLENNKTLPYDLQFDIFLLTSRANNQLGLHKEALDSAFKALKLNDTPNSISLNEGLIYIEVVKAYVGLKNTQQANHFAKLMERAMEQHQSASITYRKYLVSKSLNYELQGDYRSALQATKEVLAIDDKLNNLNVNARSVSTTLKKVETARLNYLTSIARFASQQSFETKLFLYITCLLSLALLMKFLWDKKRLQIITNSINSFNNAKLHSQGFMIENIWTQTQAQKDTTFSIALFTKNTCGNVLEQFVETIFDKRFVEFIKRVLPENIVIGRYDANMLLVVMPDIHKIEAHSIISNALDLFSNAPTGSKTVALNFKIQSYEVSPSLKLQDILNAIDHSQTDWSKFRQAMVKKSQVKNLAPVYNNNA